MIDILSTRSSDTMKIGKIDKGVAERDTHSPNTLR